MRTPAHPYTQALISAVAARSNRRPRRIILSGEPPSPIDVPTGCAFHPRCRFAQDRCRSERPELRPHADGRHVACHFTDQAAAVYEGGGADHALGTDELGRDVLSRLLVSIRISLTVAFLATLLSTLIGVTIGFLGAHFHGWFEQVVLMLVDLQAAMPFMFLALFVLAAFGNNLALFIILMGFHGWERTARLARGLALAAHSQTYVSAVREVGASPWRLYVVHVLPNTASTIIVAMTLNFPEIILLESGLSFLGLGVQPPLTSLGNMVGYGRAYLNSAAWIPLAPSLVIVLTTLSVSIVGDWLRDRLDPTLR